MPHGQAAVHTQLPLDELAANFETLPQRDWALGLFVREGKAYQPGHLHQDFGSASPLAKAAIRSFYEGIDATNDPKALVLFKQWKILFGQVCGYNLETPSGNLCKLGEFYLRSGKTQPSSLLFAVHTYYAFLVKLIAADLAGTHRRPVARQVENLARPMTVTQLRRDLADLECGSIFDQLGIINFLDGDLFSWYLEVWSEPIQAAVRGIIHQVAQYNPLTVAANPAQSRDLLKGLYQQLFPPSLRHHLGEYYTPDWLAEHVLNELGYIGDPDLRLLDPACGSGTFLVVAINRIRGWYEQSRATCGYGEAGLLKRILANVVGFDLNPLAVMAARTNYLVAIRDLMPHAQQMEIPVYLCDSILTPAEYGDLFTGCHGTVAEVPCSALKPPYLLVPKEIASSSREMAEYAAVLEMCLHEGRTPEDFLARCRQQGLTITATEAHLGLYHKLAYLEAEHKNGIWARIIKNTFAPMFVPRVDYIVGNPPWVNWEDLPADYRKATRPLWEHYGLFTLKGHAARLGGGKKDLAMLFVYHCLDSYLEEHGRLGFVITQTLFKTRQAGEGFRRFKLRQRRVDHRRGGLRYVVPLKTIDMTALHPFEGASNRTAVFICKPSPEPARWPVEYEKWSLPGRAKLTSEIDLKSIRQRITKTRMGAAPMTAGRASSPWLTAPKGAIPGLRKIAGGTSIRARAGVCTWMNGVFWLRSVREDSAGKVQVANWADVGKIKVEQVETVLEDGLVYPLLRGRDVHRWRSLPSTHLILTQDPKTRRGVLPSTMQEKYPLTYHYLSRFEALLRGRPGYCKYFDPGRDPFWSVYNVGRYSVGPFRVVFKEFADFFQCAVLEEHAKPPIADTKVRFIACRSSDSAHFLCGILNASPVVLYLYSTATWVQMPEYHAGDISRIRLPELEPQSPLHRTIIEISRSCHAAAAKWDGGEVTRLEVELDLAAGRLWGITGEELSAIHAALAEAGKTRPTFGTP